MSAPTKTSKRVAKKTEETVAAPAPVAAPAVEAAAPAPKAKAVKKAAAAAAPAAAAPVAAAPAPVAAEAAAAPAAAATEEVRLETEVKTLTSRLLTIRESVSELISEGKRLEKKVAKLQKQADKRRRRKATTEGEDGKPARVSIFQIPTNISPALCSFMGLPAGSQVSRSNVTKFITNYVRENELKNKHKINPDAKLQALLNLKPTDEQLSYFNLQRYLNVHYIKPAATA